MKKGVRGPRGGVLFTAFAEGKETKIARDGKNTRRTAGGAPKSGGLTQKKKKKKKKKKEK